MRLHMNTHLLYVVSVLALILPALARSEQTDIYFNPALLEIGNSHQEKTDLSVFESGQQAPGKYHVDIYINNTKVDARDVEFRIIELAEGRKSLQPCLSVEDLNNYGVKTELYPDLNLHQCADLSVIPDASAEFIFSNQKLALSVPQKAVNAPARGYVPPEQWDNGINAFLLNYSFSGDNTYAKTNNAQDSQSQYANLRPGINFGPWRLRNYTTWSRDTEGQDKWDSVYTYLQRNIISIKGVMTVGDSSSPSDVFDSVPFRGVQIASDDDMLADSMKGYAPVVRGIARSNAQVTIRQNGYQIYQSYVPAGAFEITDMYPTGGSGDLNVTVKEADGSEQNFVVPFASLPVLQREGRFKYSLTGGQYRSYDSDVKKTDYAQGTAIYGLPQGITVYGGVQQANVYQALAFGLGTNLGDFGALSADVTTAKATIKPLDDVEKGQSWRLRYSKNFVGTGTNFSVAGYRYSTKGFYTLQETLDSWTSDDDADPIEHPRDRQELTLSQNLWQGAGNLSLSMVKESYWNGAKSMRSYSVGYTNSWHGISYNVSYSYNKNTSTPDSENGRKTYDKDQVIALNVSIPLRNWLSDSNTQVSYSVNNSDSRGTTHNVSLSGTELAANNLSWSVQQGYDNQNASNNGNLNLDYKGTYGEVNGGYSYDANSQQINYGVSGGMIVHNNGITLSQPLGETVVLVKAPGADGVGVLNQTGVKTDFRGYTTVPYASPYRRNTVTLDGETMPSDVDVSGMTQTVIPTRGAVVRAEFNASVGNRVLMTLLRSGNTSVPFGATVTDVNQENAQGFIVGDNGQVYLTGLADKGILMAKWGESSVQQCKVNYVIPKKSTDTDIQFITGKCQ